MAIIHSLKCTVPFSFVVPLLSLTVTHFHLLSLVVTHCTTRCHSLYHSLSLAVIHFTTRCHSLSLDVPLVCLFINDLCDYSIHINRNNLNYIDYKFLQNSNDPWYCILCCSQIFPFNSVKSNKNFSVYVSNFHVNNKPVKTLNNENSLLKPSKSFPLFRKTSVFKFKDKNNLKNILFISKSIDDLLPFLFNNWFVFSSDTHKYNTSWSSNDRLQKYSYRTKTYGKNSITISAFESWNNSQNNLKTISLRLLTPNKIKLLLSNEYLKNY